MEWHINDLSLDGQFDSSDSVRSVLEPFLAFRAKYPSLRGRLYCSRLLYLRPATKTSNLMNAILAITDKNFRESALRWFANSGPFWDDDRVDNPDDLFYFLEIDVTDQGLGEAARRLLLGIDARAFSFSGAEERASNDPLVVTQGLQEAIIQSLSIQNATRVEQLLLEDGETPHSWRSLLEIAQRSYAGLVFSGEIASQLAPYPFAPAVARRAIELLCVLNEIVAHTGNDGALDSRGRELLQMYFVGEKCAFTDESESNKNRFEMELNFPDPSNMGRQLFCSWHGKIKTLQYRIHFEWPRPRGQQEIKVVYIGPKITKY